MLLFMTFETQEDVCTGGKESLFSIFREVNEKLSFVTDQSKNLEKLILMVLNFEK